MLFVGLFVNRSFTFSVSDFTFLRSWFLREDNEVFFSDMILFMNSTFLLALVFASLLFSVWFWLGVSGFSVFSISVTILGVCWYVSLSIYLLVLTCIGFHPGRVEPASSRASTAPRTIVAHVRRSWARSHEMASKSQFHRRRPTTWEPDSADSSSFNMLAHVFSCPLTRFHHFGREVERSTSRMSSPSGCRAAFAADALALFVISLFMLLIEGDTLGFDWGIGLKSYPEKRPVCRWFSIDALTDWPEAAGCRNRHLDFYQSPFFQVAALIPLGAWPIRLGWSYQELKFPTA